MEIIYRACPNTSKEKDFDSAEKCREYEREYIPKMWEMGGRETLDGELAYFVYIPEGQGSTLLKLYGEDNFAGIGCEDEGFFYWDDFDERFHFLDSATIQRVWNFIKDNDFFMEHEF